MALLEQEISLKVLYPGLEQKIYTVQSDTGRTVKCTIEDWTIPDDATATVYVMKPSKAIVFNSCTVDTDTNSVLVELTNQMLAEQGLAAAMVEITSDSEIVTAFQFGIVNRGKIAGGTESSNESTVLQTMLDELAASVTEAIARANTAASVAETATEAANEAANTANNAANNIEYIKTESAKSAKEAASSEESAEASATLSKSWAVGGTDTRDGEDEDNAKYYAEQAAESAKASVIAEENAEAANKAAEAASAAKESLDESTASAEEAAEALKEAAEEVATEATAENILALMEAGLAYLATIADTAGKADTANGFTFEKNSSDQMVVIYADEDTEETDTVTLPTETTLSAICTAMDNTITLLKDMAATDTDETTDEDADESTDTEE